MAGRLAVSVVVCLLAACGVDARGEGGRPGEDGVTTLVVFAAASLTESFTELGTRFERRHPGTDVTFSFGPSSGLAAQIGQGAPADVFAAASEQTMQQVSEHLEEPRTFARNALHIAVPADNPAGISGLPDLARPGVKVALCQEQVPCGSAARHVLSRAAVPVTPVTQEADVKATLAKVRLGEVDAAIVYVTDVLAAGKDVRGISIPESLNVDAAYPIAAVRGSADLALAQEFVAYASSGEAAGVLAAAGFAPP